MSHVKFPHRRRFSVVLPHLPCEILRPFSVTFQRLQLITDTSIARNPAERDCFGERSRSQISGFPIAIRSPSEIPLTH